MTGKRATFTGLVAISLLAVGSTPAFAADGRTAGGSTAGGRTERVSVSSQERQAGGSSFGFAISGTGRFVAFTSSATDLVARDTNGVDDIFVRDRAAGTTRRISTSATGAQADGGSFTPSISADGRYVVFVVFASYAANLVPGDTNGLSDIFLRDLRTGAIRRIVATSEDLYSATISGDGRHVAFSTAAALSPADLNGDGDIYVRDLATGADSLISVPTGASAPGNGNSYWQAISATGRFVAFASNASDLVPGDTNDALDIFLRDRVAGTTVRVSLTAGGAQIPTRSNGPAVSADGRFVAFWSEDPTIVPGDAGNGADVFLRDVRRGVTTLVSATTAGAFGNGSSSDPTLSADGRHVAFGSWSSDLVATDTNDWFDIFVRDIRTGRTELVSVANNGTQGQFGADNGAISADGRHVAFDSSSPEFVPGDTNETNDIFVRDR